jgi:hypothetical protein
MSMFPATMKGGMTTAFPNVCKTQVGPVVVPLPYPSIGMLATGVGTTTTVLVGNMPAYTQGSQLPMSNGDEAGAEGGVVSGIIMGAVAFRTVSSKVSFQGQKAVLLTAIAASNGTNANMPAGVLCLVGEMKVLVGM